jgi:hypothetical protein
MRARTVAVLAVLVVVAGGVVVAVGNHRSTAQPSPTDTSNPTRPQSSPAEPQSSPVQPRASAGAASRGVLDPAAQRYLDAVAAKDADAVASAFAPDGLVIDVGREIRGRDAIRQWAANEVIGGVYTLLEHQPRQGGVTLLVRFQPGGTGGFRANYHFDIADGAITKATLEYA